MNCPYCSKIFCVNGEKALQLHIQRVHSHALQESHCRRELPVESWQTQPDFPEEQYNCNTDVNERGDERYLTFQRTLLEKIKEHAIGRDMPKTKRNDGQYTTAKKKSYMMILVYVASRPHLSEADATSLLDLVKEITSEEGNEIGLPSR